MNESSKLVRDTIRMRATTDKIKRKNNRTYIL